VYHFRAALRAAFFFWEVTMNGAVRVAVFPVAGLGTRILPATKASPKEMLPVVDKPLIQYAVEEAIAAGVELVVFVTGRGKRAIEDHFDRDMSLEEALAAKGKHELLEAVRDVIPPHVSCAYVRQPQPLGLGHAVLCARPVVGDRPFFVVLPDDLIRSEGVGCCAQLATAAGKTGGSVLALQTIADSDTRKYGVVDTDEPGAALPAIRGIVEKPAPEDAPSRFGVVGRYLLQPAIFDHLSRTGRGAGGEIQLTDAIASLAGGSPVHGLQFEGERFDCGDKLGYVQAIIACGLAHPDVGPGLSEFIKTLINQ
jgi:UTP--glucose-1-phosphate uridylyltransferase